MALVARWLAVTLLAWALSACGDTTDATPAATPSPAASAPLPDPGTRTGPAPCPRTGHWTECIAFAYLEQAGVAPRRAGSLDGVPSLGVTPHSYTIGTNRVVVHVFPDAAARERAARSLDPARFVAPSAPLTPRGEATVIQDDNLLALLFTRLEQQRERVSDVFASGAPQP